MPRLYFLSHSDLKYRALGRGRLLTAIVLLMVLSSAMTIVMVRLGFDLFGLPGLRAASISQENSVLKARLASLNGKLKGLQNYMERLENSDDLLTTSVGLPHISPDVRNVSIGGAEENTDYGVTPTANKLISDATRTLDVLNREAKLQEDSYSDILRKYNSNQRLFAHTPAINPIRGGIVTDGFGMRFHPILRMRLMHEGIDIDAHLGTPVHITGDGVVSYVGRRGGYGNVVEIDHGFGYMTLYAHLERSLVREGDNVKRGQVIALSGGSGLTTGPHLYYGVEKDNVFVDPSGYFFEGPQFNSLELYGKLPRK